MGFESFHQVGRANNCFLIEVGALPRLSPAFVMGQLGRVAKISTRPVFLGWCRLKSFIVKRIFKFLHARVLPRYLLFYYRRACYI